MLHRSQEEIRQLKVPVNWEDTKATQSSLPEEVTTSTNKGGDDAIRSIQRPLEGHSSTGSQNIVSRPFNDLLPLEILIEIFETMILDVWASHSITAIVSHVCRSWHSAALQIQLCKTSVRGSKAMDATLEYIHTTSRYKEDGTAGIRDLAVLADHDKDFHRLPELLDLCRSSLQVLFLGGLLLKDVELWPLLGDKQETGGDFYLPALKALSLSWLRSTDLFFLLTVVDPAKLRSLKLYAMPIPSDDETHAISFPHLQELTIHRTGTRTNYDPTLLHLCRVAPNLETLDVSIIQQRLETLTKFLASDRVPNSLKMLKVSVEYNQRHTRWRILDKLIEKWGWKNYGGTFSNFEARCVSHQENQGVRLKQHPYINLGMQELL